MIGRTVYLLGCPAEITQGPGAPNLPVSLIGLFDIEEFQPYEPSAHCYSPGYMICPNNPPIDQDFWIFVEAEELIKQVDPKQYARSLALEREMEFAAERNWV